MQYIGYFRVSTDKQGAAGLGMEAQASAVQAYLDRTGGVMLDRFTEVESGRKNDRPELHKALTRCRLQNAVLLVAKLDRLSRSVSMISSLMDAKVRFIAADMPQATELTVHVLAAMAQHEREQISARTKAALAEAKKRGVILGNPQLDKFRCTDLSAANIARRKKAQAYAVDMQEVIADMSECRTLQQKAEELTKRGFRTPRGSTQWHPAQVGRVLSVM